VVATGADGIFGSVPTTLEGLLIEDVLWGFTLLSIYGWIASNIDVAVTADYFNRDPLGWRKGGKWLALAAVVIAYASASLPSWWFPEVSSNAIISNGIVVLFFLASAYAALDLALIYRRVRDHTLRRYTLWVVLSIACLLTLIVVPVELALVLIAGWVYFMYRSVGALAIRTDVLPS